MAALNIPEAPAIDGATHVHSGKVRDLYRLPDGNLLMVASDRISAYDFVLDTTIPDKGEILTRMSLWWFDQLADLVPNHVVSTDVPDAGDGPGGGLRAASTCSRSSASPAATSPAPGLVDYRATGEVCGIALPDGLEDGSRLAGADLHPGHQGRARRPRRERLVRRGGRPQVGHRTRRALRDLTLAVYARAEEIARERGIILADTKFEFGRAERRHDRARRRGAHPRLVALLARRRVAARPHAAVVRQADRAQLADLGGERLGPRRRARRRRRCRSTSSTTPAPGTSRPTSGSPAARSG